MKNNSSQDLIDINKISLHKAKLEDMMDVFNLANDPEVRKNSFNQKQINLEDHKIWFSKKICDQNCLLLISKIDDDFVGSIRFEQDTINQENYNISIQISKKFRGKKIAEPLLKLAINEFLKNFKNYNIIAKIKTDNSPSIKIFIKNNFVALNENEKENYISLKYNSFNNI
ncbi:MAG: GNAT family N-acetyltransferase; N-acetyltransferase [Alphaproteobacteria bacterium]